MISPYQFSLLEMTKSSKEFNNKICRFALEHQNMRFTFTRTEKLKSRKLIGQLFEQGQHLKAMPLQVVYLAVDHDGEFPIKAGFSVSKRNFKKAVDRNRIKRLMRESYRLNKHKLYKQCTKKYVLMFIYTGHEMHDYKQIEEALIKLLDTLIIKLNH